MRKFVHKSATPSGEGESRASIDDGQGWFRKKWRLITLMAIIIAAFLIRFVFAFGVSAGDGFALSGGSGASSHANTIVSILNGTFITSDSALNYPFGTLNIYPPLMDFILAIFAGIVSIFGVSVTTAAAGTLAFATPIVAALTCYPVYLIAKKMFNDEHIGLLSALLYAFFGLLIMTSVFSNGTEYAFVGFFFAWMVYFILKALECVDASDDTGFGSIFRDKAVLKNTILAGILFLCIALSWNQFRIILTCLVFFMVAQALIDRFRSKEISQTVGVYSVIILLGVLLSAPYYIVAGLWDAVFSGPLVIGLLAVILMVLFCKTSNKSWVIMIPVLAVVTAVIFIAMYFGVHDLYSAVVFGNSYYEGSLMGAIVSSTHTSVSAMAAYFGWVTVWLPIAAFAYMAYKFRKNMDSRKYTFTMFWIIAMFWISWYSVSYAVIAGAGFAIGSALIILKTYRYFHIRAYLSSIRGNGFKAGIKKALKPVPLATVLGIVCLIVLPNAVYALDASTPTNIESSDGYLGGLGYTISTSDVSSMNKLWDSYSDEEKSGAIITWLSYSNDAAYQGKFTSVTDTLGGGSSVMANLLLSNGSSGATAVMALRLMMSGNISDYRNVIDGAGLDFSVVSGYIFNPSTAVKAVIENIEEYPGIASNVTEENAVYLVITNYITSTLNEPDVDLFYDAVCAQSGGEKISYVAVNGSMIPLYYNDGSYFSTIAYFGNYISDSNGASTGFFSYDTTTKYAKYTDAMYETFLWKSLIGINQTDAGYSSTVSFLSALAISDGSLKAVPGYGLSGYSVAYWHVMYNSHNDAKLSSDGWEEMDAYEAIALQNEKGGVINYLSGVVLLEYGTDNTKTVSGVIDYTGASGEVAAEGIEVTVYTRMTYDSSGVTTYIPTCVVKTLANGSYKITVPTNADYYVVFSSGATTTAGGSAIETFTDVAEIDGKTYVIGATSLSGTIVCNANAYTEGVYVVIEGQTTGMTKQVSTDTGSFVFSNLVPDKYTVTVNKADGTVLSSTTATVCVGNNSGMQVSATSGKVTVTVTDEYGASVLSGSVVATDISTGFKFTAEIDEGSAVLNVVPGTYNISATNGKISISTSTVTVTNNSSKTSTLTVYDSKNVTVSGAPAGALISLMSFGFTSSSSTSTTFEVPTSGGSTGERYTAYSISNGMVYYGSSDGTSITMTGSNGYTVSGTLKNSSGAAVSGTISFLTSTGATLIFTSDSDGKYTAVLPAGSYSIYAYDAAGSAYLNTITVSGDTTKDILMESGRTITSTLRYYTQLSSSGTKGIAFVDVKLDMTIDGTNYSIVVKTNSSGKAYFYVPSGHSATVGISEINTDEFYCEAQSKEISSGTSSDSVTWSLAADPKDSTTYVKTVSVSSPYTVSLTLYSDSKVKYTINGTQSIMVGRYTAVVDGSTGYYFSGSVYVYPGQNGALVMDGVEVVTVTLNASAQDGITVTAIKDTDDKAGAYYKSEDNPLVYYVQKGYDYLFTAKNGSTGTETLGYASITKASSNVTLDLNNLSKPATIKGYVGVVADGTLTVSYGSVVMYVDIKSGEFEFDVPTNVSLSLSASVSQTVSGIVYEYVGSTNLASEGVIDGARVNFSVITSSYEPKVEELSGSGEKFVDGVGSFMLSIKNTGSYANTYIITGGSAWNLDKTYTLVVDGKSTGTILITGYYDKSVIGAGNENLSVSVSDISGKSVGSYVLVGDGFSKVNSTTTYVDVSGTDDAKADSISTYEYLYAVTITNNDCYLKNATISVSLSGLSSGWMFVISNEGQTQIYNNGSSFAVNGYGATTIYVKVMNENGSSKSVPGISVTVTVTGETVGTNSTSVNASGSTATAKLSAASAEMDSSNMSASGSSIFNSASKIPTMFWVLMVICVLALIFTAWEGTKRGVFARKK